jgi:hypothetical protein
MLTKEKIEENRRWTKTFLKSTSKHSIDDLIEFMMRSDFFTAPASTRLDYHGAYEGGLAQHSINVYNTFQEKVEAYNLDISEDEVVISALLHDICKVDTYKPNVLKSGKLSPTKPYIVEDAIPVGHGEKSLYIASSFIELTANEALLIRWHMGPFDSQWENYEAKVAKACPGIYAFQTADMEASKYLD